jgi:hypothetical protein
MSTIAVQYQDELTLQMPMQQGNELDHSLKVDVPTMDLKVEPQAMSHRRGSNLRNRRKPIMTIPTVQDRCLSSWRPGAAHKRLKHIAAFIDQYDWTTIRSRARRFGFWGLYPIPLRMCHTYLGWYVTLNSPAITWATRFRVHKSVGKLAALAPFNAPLPSSSSQ